MSTQKISAKVDEIYTFKLTGNDLVALMLGLEEIQHKQAKPVEIKLMEQLDKQVKKRLARG